MKFQPDRFDAPAVLSYGPDWVVIRGARTSGSPEAPLSEKLQSSLVLCSHGERIDWHCDRFEQLNATHFAQLADLPVEIVIFGSGQRQRFVPPAWLAPLMHKHMGMETMDMAAACRTYNILASEGRKVALALLLETADSAAS
jgi:uncharacterized protein